MKRVGFIYDDIYLLHEMPEGHPESKDRLLAICNTLKQSDLWDKLLHVKPRRAGTEDILAVHTRAYLEKVMKFTGYYDPDTFVSINSVEAAFYAAGQ